MDKQQRQQVSGNKREKKTEPQTEGCKTNQMFKTKEILVSMKMKTKEIT